MLFVSRVAFHLGAHNLVENTHTHACVHTHIRTHATRHKKDGILQEFRQKRLRGPTQFNVTTKSDFPKGNKKDFRTQRTLGHKKKIFLFLFKNVKRDTKLPSIVT